MPAVAVRHERRKKKQPDKNNRPNRLLLKPHVNKGELSPGGSHAPSANPSRQGSPTHQLDDHAMNDEERRYGDECFYGKLSLLHFIIFFFLGGLTVLIVGAVQFKKEAGLSSLRYHFLVIGGILVAVGFLLLVVKCACFRIPLPDQDFDDELMQQQEEFHSPHGEKKQNKSPNGTTNNQQQDATTNLDNNDHNHTRENKDDNIEKLS